MRGGEEEARGWRGTRGGKNQTRKKEVRGWIDAGMKDEGSEKWEEEKES